MLEGGSRLRSDLAQEDGRCEEQERLLLLHHHEVAEQQEGVRLPSAVRREETLRQASRSTKNNAEHLWEREASGDGYCLYRTTGRRKVVPQQLRQRRVDRRNGGLVVTTAGLAGQRGHILFREGDRQPVTESCRGELAFRSCCVEENILIGHSPGSTRGAKEVGKGRQRPALAFRRSRILQQQRRPDLQALCRRQRRPVTDAQAQCEQLCGGHGGRRLGLLRDRRGCQGRAGR
mmetsp:Transcript_30899/g.91834  ORF Transcript_30899/g.91834 Transcript_30899/m.91834 type:complete len:233 (+) Transcript_30899:806-1504(+)